jgi:hypothetical protein
MPRNSVLLGSSNNPCGPRDISAGLDADIVVYGNDPTMDLRALEKPILVITRGSVYVDNLASGDHH